MLKKVNHPNIIKIYGHSMNNKTKPARIVFERCLSNVKEMIQTNKFTKVDASFAIYQIAEGMKFVHSNKIIHLNLKPSNILIGTDGMIKISDIGINMLKMIQNQQILMNNDINSLYFKAPEVLNNGKCDEKIDVYSFGVLVYFIISGGQLPNTSFSELIQRKTPQVPPSFSPNAKEIIEFCCNINPQERPSFSEIVDYLKNEQCILMDLSKLELIEVQNRIK